MKRTQIMWYVLAVVLVTGPALARMAFWPGRSNTPVDPAMAEAGKVLFNHEWQPNDPLSPDGDGLGPVFNARSCVACHKQGGIGGGGGLEHNVTTFVSTMSGKVRQGVVHSDAVSPQFQETLQNVHPTLPPLSRPTLADIRNQMAQGNLFGHQQQTEIAQRNTPALFGAHRIDQIPDRVIIAQERSQRVRWGVTASTSERLPVGRAFLLPGGKVGKFGWKAQSASVIDFVEAACANELGLSNPGQAQPVSLNRPDYRGKGLDLTTEQCLQIAAFISALPEPRQKNPDNARDLDRVHQGQRLFGQIGCADCHVPNLDSIPGIYSDMLLHRLGQDLEGRSGGYNSPSMPDSPGDGPLPDEWRTPPLWGVADSAPYMHDGRAPTLEEAIRMHGGQAQSSTVAFNRLSDAERNDVVAFLRSLRAPY